MSTIALSGNDTININNRIFADLADGDVVKLSFSSDIAQVKTGKNGNSIYALNETGKQIDVEVRLIRGAPDDVFMNSLLASQQANFAATVLLVGEFVKQLGNGQGNLTYDTYIMSGGIFVKQVDASSNVEGNVDQSVSVYHLKFSNAPRAIVGT